MAVIVPVVLVPALQRPIITDLPAVTHIIIAQSQPAQLDSNTIPVGKSLHYFLLLLSIIENIYLQKFCLQIFEGLLVSCSFLCCFAAIMFL
jgi:hypothetical protein